MMGLFQRRKRGQFVILAAVIIVFIMLTVALAVSYLSIYRVHFLEKDFREVTSGINSDLHGFLASTLSNVTKAMDDEARAKRYENYTTTAEYDQDFPHRNSQKISNQEMMRWQNLTIYTHPGLGLNLHISSITLICNWTGSPGYSHASGNIKIDLITYGFYGWEDNATAELLLSCYPNSLSTTNGGSEDLISFRFRLVKTNNTPVSDVFADLVIILYETPEGVFRYARRQSIELIYLGGGDYIVSFSGQLDAASPEIKIIVRDSRGIVVGSHATFS